MKIGKITRIVAPLALVSGLILTGCSSTTAPEEAAGDATSEGSIVLSNSFVGNAWRQTMVDNALMSSEQAVQAGLASEIKIVNSNNDVAEQISQIQSLILEQPKVILVLAASPTALNGVIQTACDAGIKVLAFDASVTAECAYKLAPDWVSFGRETMQVVAEKMGGTGNVVLVRGVDGVDVDLGMYEGWTTELSENYPDINIVGEVNGNWDDATTQSAVSGILSTAGQIDGVMAYVSSYGVVQAFEAANLPLPVVYGSNQGTFLKWWAEQNAENGYSTESAMEGPAISSAAYWIGVALANGEEFDKNLVYPTFTITDDTVAEFAASTAPDGFADQVWTQESVMEQWPSN
jgi:ribose transport system substrate-binding protein